MKTKTLALLTALAAVSLPQAAFAYDPDKTADVLSRPRPEFDARGVRLGSFMLFPTLSAGVAYQDNVFNVPDGAAPQEDFLFTLTPSLRLNSDWGRHALNFHAQSKSYFYQDFSSEDRTDWKVGGDARFDISGGTNFTVDAVYEDVTEPRGIDPSLAAVFFDQTEYTHWGVGAGLNHVGGRFRGSIGARYDEFDFDDTASIGLVGTTNDCQGTTIVPTPVALGTVVNCNNDDRDQAVFAAFVKGGFELTPGYAVFLRGRYKDSDFNSANAWNFSSALNSGTVRVAGQTFPLEVADDNTNHDSQEWGVDAGVDFELARLLVGEAYVGYTSREYDAHPSPLAAAQARNLPDTDSFVYGVNLQWFAQEMTTVSFDIKRSIEDSLDARTNASGFISDRYGVRVDHELMRNVVLYGKVGFGQDDFEGSPREDDIFQGGLGAIFLVNNNLHVTASYDFVDRDSNDAVFDYTNNAFMLTLTGKL